MKTLARHEINNVLLQGLEYSLSIFFYSLKILGWLLPLFVRASSFCSVGDKS